MSTINKDLLLNIAHTINLAEYGDLPKETAIFIAYLKDHFKISDDFCDDLSLFSSARSERFPAWESVTYGLSTLPVTAYF